MSPASALSLAGGFITTAVIEAASNMEDLSRNLAISPLTICE